MKRQMIVNLALLTIRSYGLELHSLNPHLC